MPAGELWQVGRGVSDAADSIQIDNYHSLVALDTSGRKHGGVFGYVSWVYKAVSLKTGDRVCLRRLEGYRLSNENAMRPVKDWKRIDNGGVVRLHDAFTTRGFGDSSLVFVQDYFPLSKTLAEHHFPSSPHSGRYRGQPAVPEDDLWGYIVQIANALSAIHTQNLAARCLDLTKMILTDKRRIRLTGCAVPDVVNAESRRPLAELQQEDFQQFGRAMLSLATGTPQGQLNNVNAAVEALARSTFSQELKELVRWLILPQQPGAAKNVDSLRNGLSKVVVRTFDSTLHAMDSLNKELHREVENGRLVRLMLKLGAINERDNVAGDPRWSEHSERYMLKLFRDYVFHGVDKDGNPVLDMGHMLRALNKLDAGTDELVRLTSRDNESEFVVSYKELNKLCATAFGELIKLSRQGGQGI